MLNLHQSAVRRASVRRVAPLPYLVVILAATGCSSRPSAVLPPDIDPERIAAAAVEQYDTSGDGVIDTGELASAPSLSFSQDRIDANQDGQIVVDEIAEFAREHWIETQVGIIRVRCVVNHGGRPLDGAIVTLEPEQFMQGAVKPASGLTRGGLAVIGVAEQDRPHPNARGVQNGLYLVRISKVVNGQETIPGQYNEQTILGCEVADRASYMPGPIVFDL